MTNVLVKPRADAPPYIGTAGWTLPREGSTEFGAEGTHLVRYARVFNAAEINSSFHRPHRASTYERWAASVPETFRFAVKLPKEITHKRRLDRVEELLDGFLIGVLALREKLGCLLVQLPPSLAFEESIARSFFGAVRNRYGGGLVCEPRHASWLEPEAEALLFENCVARVAADPDQPAGAAAPGGWPELSYHRLHGSPRMYYSSYSRTELLRVGKQLTEAVAERRQAWCIFDNTASGAAVDNALEMKGLLDRQA